MKSKIKITQKEYNKYIDFLKGKIDEGHVKYIKKSIEDVKQVKNLEKVLDENYGFLTKISNDNYKQCSELLDDIEDHLKSNRCIIEEFPIRSSYYGYHLECPRGSDVLSLIVPEEDNILELKKRMKEERNNPTYKILHSIESFGKRDTKDTFASPILTEVRNRAVDAYIGRKLKVGEHSSVGIKLDQEKSEKLSIPVYCIQGNWPIFFFDNNKKEMITLPGGGPWPSSRSSIEVVDSNTKKLTSKTRTLGGLTTIYCDKEDIVPLSKY